jgi:hypothetical protein
VNRAALAQVRNPLLQLPAVAELQALPRASQAALKGVLKAISADARERAEKCWRTHKAPMAAYWKAVAVYANHTSRVLVERKSPSYSELLERVAQLEAKLKEAA